MIIRAMVSQRQQWSRNRTKRIKPENDESSAVVTTGPTGPDDRTMNGKQAMKPVLEKEDKLLARRARSNQKTEDIRRRSSSCAETFSSSLPANFAKQAR
ncbi:hypothetical protein T09_50 [Trichinella sp. T9]|nr:hypothetical protein T09_50 [Trichinella sp. T9]